MLETKWREDGVRRPARPRRNTRPRDRLGRPLPYGSVGVPAPPEGAVRAPAAALQEAQQLLDDGYPFAAHEVLEDAWKGALPAERELWRGLAQLAVGLTHAERGNVRGAAALLRRGAASLGPYRDREPYGLPVAALADWAEAAGDAIERGAYPSRPPRLR
jgi:hypothetical protein